VTRRRAASGSGGISSYTTKQGERRYRVVYWYLDANGIKRQTTRRGFTTQKQAVEFSQSVAESVRAGRYVAPERRTFGSYLDSWHAGLRLAESTRSSYEKNIRLHVKPQLGSQRLDRVSPAMLTTLYRQLEASGRHSGKGGLKARTVRYIHTIVHHALADAVREGILVTNPADRAKPPTAMEARAPEMVTWSADQMRGFLDTVSRERLHPLWLLLATTGVRRGEALGLRWKDVDLDARRAVIRQTVTAISGRVHLRSTTKTGKTRVVDLDTETASVLRAHKASQAQERLAAGERWVDHGLVFTKDDSRLGTGGAPGDPLHPERLTRTLQRRIRAYNMSKGTEPLPVIGPHGLRHTWATLAMAAGIHPKIVQERLGHASIAITLDLYSHVTPTMQSGAAQQVAELFTSPI
jgi:integrase